MDIEKLDINAVCFGILCNFTPVCGEEKAKEAVALIRSLQTENEKLQAEVERQRRSADNGQHLYENAERAYMKVLAELEQVKAERDAAVEVHDTLREFAEDVARQFGYHGTTPDGRPAYTTGGLSTLEWAWSLLGWPDPKPAPECECQEDGCHEWATGGRPTPDGYKWLCGRHFAAYEARQDAEAALRREQE